MIYQLVKEIPPFEFGVNLQESPEVFKNIFYKVGERFFEDVEMFHYIVS